MQSRYWHRVQGFREVLSERFLDGSLHITAVENDADGEIVKGHCKPASIEVAARHIARGTHRIARDEEIKAYLAYKASERERLHAAEALRRQNSGNVVVVNQAPQAVAAIAGTSSGESEPTGMAALSRAQLRKIADGLDVDSRLKDPEKLIAAIGAKSAEVDEPTEPADPDETEEVNE